jgi:two-component system, NarL family, nitrate/nitrite response regulator NarL
MSRPEQITVLLADDNAAIRHSLRTLLNEDGQIHVVGEAKNGREAVAMSGDLSPNVILMDISMPVFNGLEAARQILASRSSPKIIMLSAYDDPEYKDRARDVGAAGFIAKQAFAETLPWAIHEVARGRMLFDPAVTPGGGATSKHSVVRSPTARGVLRSLTTRETRLMQLLAEGFTKRKIAAKLCISAATVERHLANLIAKLGLQSFAKLADYAVASSSVVGGVVLTIT